jgi:hypothetical protein
VPFTTAALPAIMALHAAEPVRFVRPPADWERLVSCGVIFYDPARLFTVERGGRAVAYLVLGRRTDASAAAGDAWRALELGGDRAAIVDALPSLLGQLGVDAVDLVMPPHDRSLDRLARAAGWQAEPVSFPFSATWWNGHLAGHVLPWYGLNYV